MADRRVDWHTYFMNMAREASTRSTCDRKHVGAVIVSEKTILSTGYNGAPRGLPHCDEAGHEIVAGHCVRTIHAEANAMIQAARSGASIMGSTIYLTNSPCYDCFKMMVNVGIKEVFYKDFYMSRYELSGDVLTLSKKSGVRITKFK